jgi:arginine/ornithine transport system permease protein
MGPQKAFLRITAPQMVRYALPGFTNNWLVLIKATALVSLIGLQEMTYLAKQASAATRSPFVYLLFAGALFLVYTWVSLEVLRRLNARYSLGTKRITL